MANVTSSGNTTIKPTINTAKFMGSSHAAGNALSNQVQINTKSISSIKSVLDSETLKVSNLESQVGSHQSALEETNNILTDIGNALSLDFANRIAEVKDNISNTKAQKSRGKFGRAEGRLEGKEKKIGSALKGAESKAASPVQGIFGKIMSFLGLLGTGIAANAGFEWLKDDKNKKKLSTFFKIIQKNWKWMAGTAAILVGAKLLLDLGLVVGLIGGVLAALSNPVFLGVLAIAASGMGAKWMLDKVNEYYADDPTGKKNFVGAPIPGAPKDANPGDYFQDNKGKWWIKQDFDSSNGGWSGPRNKPPSAKILKMTGGVELQREGSINKVDNNSTVNQINKNTINKINKNIPNNKIDAISKKPGINLIPMDLPAITAKMPEISTPSGPATEAPDIASTNGADQYRYITSSIYGIFV